MFCGYHGDVDCTGNVGGEYVHSGNIRSFEGCTVIKGAIKIFPTTLSGYVTFRRSMQLLKLLRMMFRLMTAACIHGRHPLGKTRKSGKVTEFESDSGKSGKMCSCLRSVTMCGVMTQNNQRCHST